MWDKLDSLNNRGGKFVCLYKYKNEDNRRTINLLESMNNFDFLIFNASYTLDQQPRVFGSTIISVSEFFHYGAEPSSNTDYCRYLYLSDKSVNVVGYGLSIFSIYGIKF